MKLYYGRLNSLSEVYLEPGVKWTPEIKREILYCMARMADMLDKNGETGLTEDAREILYKFIAKPEAG